MFILFFNDFKDCLSNANAIMYADDTVVYYADDDIHSIEKCLTAEFENISQYLEKCELVINLKKGKTESMLLGTAKKLSKIVKPLEIYYRGTAIHQTHQYKYLGNVIDPSLNLTENFQNKYKRASGRLRLLGKVRPFLTQKAAKYIYTMMILPLLLYCSLLHLKMTDTQKKSLKSIENRASKLINKCELPSIEDQIKKKCCVVVRQCLNGESCNPFNDYFEINNHTIRTRNQSLLLVLPKVRLEFGKRSFRFMGAKLFNDLPKSVREESATSTFKKKLLS